jgi:PBP1b-binding outer membrane lipoprotein LpoB
MIKKVAPLFLLAVALAGCTSYVAPEDRVLIQQSASNARVFSTKVDEDAAVPPYVKTWIKGDVQSWNELEKWGNSHTSN